MEFDQPKKWHRVGTFVALDGAFHGLESGSSVHGEWRTDGEFMRKLLAEDIGGGRETPFGKGKPKTPPPYPHNITYFCGIAKGDLIDSKKSGTGELAGAINKTYDFGFVEDGHKGIKEDEKVFNDFLPYLNSVPPVPPVKRAIDKTKRNFLFKEHNSHKKKDESKY